MEPWLVTVILFSSLIVGILLGFPIAFVLAGIGVTFTFVLWGTQALLMLPTMLYSTGTNFVLIAVPLFVLMANFLEVSGIAEDLYKTMYCWVGAVPGGLASGTVVICAIFAAMAGISGVATVTMGLIAIPSMLKRGYDTNLAVGTVAAGGALGILIPPSIIAIIYGSVTETSVGKLFMGGIVPGILLAIFFIIYITIRSFIQPRLAPPLKEKFTVKQKLVELKSVVFPLLLIFLVLGSIYFGVCTPTEAAGIGAFGALICCVIRRKLSWLMFKTAIWRTLTITVMCVWIIFGASCFTSIYTVGGASEFMINLVQGLAIPPIAMILIMMLIWMVMGMLLDPVGMCLITVPIFVPIIITLGFDPLWFGILFIINCEMAYITPPFGFNLFYMKAIAPEGVGMGSIYRSVIPFVAIQFICLILVVFFPHIALWLPQTMIK